MTTYTPPIIGTYGPLARALQQSLSFEHTTLTWKTANVFLYLGSRTNLTPAITDVQDPILLEARDRAYATTSIEINLYVQPLPEQIVDFQNLGIINPLGNEQKFKVHINSFASDGLGRYLIPGDVIQIPFWQQDGYPTYFEVSDVDRKQEFENFYVVVTGLRLDDKMELVEILNARTMTNLTTEAAAMDTIVSEQVPVDGVTNIQTSISAIQITHGGTLYTKNPIVTITGGGGTGATAQAFISGGIVTIINLTDAGTGYTTIPTITITPAAGDVTGSGATAIAVISGAATVTDPNTANSYNPRFLDENEESFLDNPDRLDY